MLCMVNPLLCERWLDPKLVIDFRGIHCTLCCSEPSCFRCSRFIFLFLFRWLSQDKSQFQRHTPLLVLEYLAHEDLRSVLNDGWLLLLVLYALFFLIGSLPNLCYSWLVLLLLVYFLDRRAEFLDLTFFFQYLRASFHLKLQCLLIDRLLIGIKSRWARGRD